MPACRQCGEENPQEARLCWACGARLHEVSTMRAGEERRFVTVVFVDLVGFTGIAEQLDPEDLNRVLTPYYLCVRTELERFGGHVEKFVGDAVMALFGAPVAHGDDAERAVRAAFAIRQEIEELNAPDPEIDLQVRIGVNTGEVFLDLGADTGRGEAMAAGDVIVTCFRLQEAAPIAGILVGESTYHSTARAIEYREVEPVAAKGKQALVRTWEAVAPRAGEGRPLGRLVGRETELDQLRLLVEEQGGRGRLATLVGPPGIGKSRLLWELEHAPGGLGASALWRRGKCLSYGSSPSFWAFGVIVKTHAGILETDTAEAVERKLAAAVGAAVDDPATRRWTEAYLRPLVGLEGAERLSGDRRGEAFAAWRRFLEGVAERTPAVLAFEDLHWADDGLLDFLEHLVDWAREVPLTLICTARPELLDRRPDWGGVVRLEPLSTDDTAALVEGLLAPDPLPAELRDSLLARAAGNPLYAEEFVRMLQERDAGELRLPETVQAIIAARLDLLHAEAKELLQDASVVGSGFWVGALARMSGLGPEQVERRLGELQAKEFVRPSPRSAVAGESQYTFWHVLVRDVAYGQIPRARRAEKHRLAAEWIESLAPDRADLTEMLAYHYTTALRFARLSRQETRVLEREARLVLRDAGDHVLTLYAFAAAVGFFRDALELWPPDDAERPQLLFRLGKALFWAERGGDAELGAARDALLAIDDRPRAAEAEVMLSRLALARGDRDEASSLAEHAVELLRDLPPSREKAESVSNLAALHAGGGDPERALESSGEAMALAEALGLGEIRAQSLTFSGHARILGGDHDGIDDLEHAVEIAEQLNSPVVVRSFANLATALVELGDLARAWAAYEQGRVAAERFGDALGLHWLSAERPYELYWRGEWDAALAAAKSSLLEADAGYSEHASKSVRAWIRLARGDLAGALEDAAGALDFARRAKDPPTLCQALALHARVSIETGRQDEAAKVVEELLELCAAPGTLASFWTADLAEALHDLGNADALETLVGGAGTATRWLVAARHLLAGAYVEAADHYAAIGALPEEAKARMRGSAALAGAGNRAAAEGELERALSFYRRVGADAYVRAGEALLAAPA